MNVREILRGPKVAQSPGALRAAGTMLLLLPLAQVVLVVGVLNSELWIGLLGLEGLLMGALARQQLARRDAQYRLVGLGFGLLNVVALSIVGLFARSQLFWITGVLGFLPAAALVLLPTGKRTVATAWLTWALAFALLIAAAGVARFCVETAGADEAATRRWKLEVAWAAFVLRGGNGTERALLRLRMAQAAYDLGEYQDAFLNADDGLRHGDGRWRDLPATPMAEPLFKSLLNIKAQAFYNAAWGKNEPMRTVIKPDPLDASTLSEAAVRWGF